MLPTIGVFAFAFVLGVLSNQYHRERLEGKRWKKRAEDAWRRVQAEKEAKTC